MNNMIKKMMMTGIACVALCGTTLAAPAHNNRPMPKGKAPMAQIAKPMPKPMVKPAQHKVVAKPMPKPAPHKTAARPTPPHHAAPHHVHATHHMPPPRPVTPCHRHHRHDCHDCHYDHNGWVELGAGIIVTAALAGLAI